MTNEEERAERAEIKELARALHWRWRFRVGKVAHGWIVEDMAIGGTVSAAAGAKLTFHMHFGQAEAARIAMQRLARDGWMPVPLERIEALRDRLEAQRDRLTRELDSLEYYNQRHAKVLRSRIVRNAQTLASVLRTLEKQEL